MLGIALGTHNEGTMARLAFAIALLLIGCTTDQVIPHPDGTRDYVIACGAGLGWNICHRRANELCPTGYNTLTQEAGFNRKELTISCPDLSSASVKGAYAQCTYEASRATVTMGQGKEGAQAKLFQQCMAVRATRNLVTP